MSKFLLSIVIGTSLLSFSLPSQAMEEGDDDSRAKTTTLCLKNLPYEIHVMIVGWCPPPTLGILARVSGYWKVVSEDNAIWKNIAAKRDLTLPKETLGLGQAKLKVKEEKELSTAIVTIENGSESKLQIKPILEMLYGPSIMEINNWRGNQNSSELVSKAKAHTPLPNYNINSGEKLVIEWDIVQKHFNLPQAPAYTGDIPVVTVITPAGKGGFAFEMIPNKKTSNPLNKRNAFKITSTRNPRGSNVFTLEPIN